MTRSGAVIAPYALTTRSDLQLFSPAVEIFVFSEATTVHISSIEGHCGMV